MASTNEAAAFGRRQAKAARNGHRAGADPRIARRIGKQRRGRVDPAFTEPHPRRPDRKPRKLLKRYPYAGQIGPHHLLSETSPNPRVTQFDSLAKGFNGIITKL
jgi:hypothetical protein